MNTQSERDKWHEGNIPGPLRLYNEMTCSRLNQNRF